MAVSKRKRYEVFRRDSFTCRYCGAKAPDVELTIDHVNPQALVEDDATTNLVTCCKPCNSGKSSVPPDAPLVADVEEKALQWSRAMNTVLEQRAADRAGTQAHIDRFDAAWKAWVDGVGDEFPRDPDWRTTIRGYLTQGLDHEDFVEAIDIAMSKRDVRYDVKWRYFCGCCRNAAKEILDQVAAATKPAARTSAAPEENDDSLPEFDLTCDYVRKLVEVLGGDEQVGKFAESHLASVLSADTRVWATAVEAGDEDRWDTTWLEHGKATARVMLAVSEWREQRAIRALQAHRADEFNPINLADSFLTEAMIALELPAETRSALHRAYWDAMQEAHHVYTAGEVPDGIDLGEWVEEQFDNVAAPHLARIGKSDDQVLTAAMARHYVRRMLERANVDETDIAAAVRVLAYVLGRGTREYAEASARHTDMTDPRALDLAYAAMDEQITEDLGVAGSEVTT